MRLGMYTAEGDKVAAAIVKLSKTANLNWATTYQIMRLVADANPDRQGELMDTAVREAIYDRWVKMVL